MFGMDGDCKNQDELVNVLSYWWELITGEDKLFLHKKTWKNKWNCGVKM